jgi:hypothetical protein
MKNRFVRVTVITIILLIFYFTFFIEEVQDPAKTKNPLTENMQRNDSDTIFNRDGYLVIGKPNEIVLIKKTELSDKRDGNYHRLAEYKDDILLMKELDSGFVEVYRKYDSIYSFEDFETPVHQGKLADPDFATNPDAKMFITRITDGCDEGINFAGHYTLVYWGCGTSCQSGVIVDRKTGKIYDGFQTSMGAEYRKDSKLMFKNYDLLDEEGYFPLNYHSRISAEVWENNKFRVLD